MKTYLFIYSEKMGDREYLKQLLNSMPEISSWRYDIPNCFYLQSEYSAQDLVDLIVEKLPADHSKRFFISEIGSNRQGYLNKDTWNFIKMKNIAEQMEPDFA